MLLLFVAFNLALCVLGGAALLLLCCRLWLMRKPNSSPTVIGFFHPYCNSGGGGERVLWCALRALEEINDKIPLSVIIYTGDSGITAEDFFARARDRFGVELKPNVLPVRFVYLTKRNLLEASRYPRFTMIGQSVGSMILAWEALCLCTPDVFIDTTGFAFTFFLARWLGGCKVAAYVHYPTISTDMLELVHDRRPTYNNDSNLAKNKLKSWAKLQYYRMFAFCYSLCGRLCDIVMVNSSWTQGHILQLWQKPKITSVVFPPCDTTTLQKFPLAYRGRFAVSVGQFRPEKDHSLQLRAFKLLREQSSDYHDVRLQLVGSCRDRGDRQRVEKLKEEAAFLGISDRVDFHLNVSFAELQGFLGRASVGLHTMWNEHFGIGVVEMQAAGLVTIAHDSGGPKSDIIVHNTGFLAATDAEYADYMAEVFSPRNDAKMLRIRQAGRKAAARFSDEVFHASFQSAITPIFAE